MNKDPGKPESVQVPARRNKRRFPRYSLDVRVSVSVFRNAGVSNLWGRSTELGADGIGCTLTGDLQPGEVVSMEFHLPLSSSPLKLRAIVRYGQGLHYGFEFLTVTQEQRHVIQRVCEMLAASGVSDTAGK
jgi:PilZ domain-containing protein